MKVVSIILIFSFLLLPAFVFADCGQTGTTVVFINGIWENYAAAQSDKKEFQYQYKLDGKNQNVTFINGYNASHGGGAIDVVESIMQAYGLNGIDYDLTNILLQLHSDLKTQKILLVGHSQGTFYTNAAYDYLIHNGVNKNSIAVYNVATPADSVAGGGRYLTSSTDGVINQIVANLAKAGDAHKPLPANIDISIPSDVQPDSEDGHSFSAVYLGLAPDRVISDMDKEISNLQSGSSDPQDCFTAPKRNVIYNIQDGSYTTVDQTVFYFSHTPTSPLKSPQEAAAIAKSIAGAVYNWAGSLFSGFKIVLAKIDSGAFLTSTLPGYSVVESSSPDVSSATPIITVDTSIQNVNNSINGTENGEVAISIVAPESRQDIIDDIQEKLDILKQKVQDIADAQNSGEIVPPPASDDSTNQPPQDQNQNNNQNNNTNTTNGGSGPTYPKVLISEVQVAGTSSSQQEFVELYNPNTADVSLDGWYVQRKTAGSQTWSTYAANSSFSGKMIPAKGYFLIARTGYYTGLADIFTNNPITNDNSFALKNPSGDVSDKVGFGNAADPELLATVNPGTGQSIGRKVLSDMTEQDTDNNLDDFQLQTPTPKTSNLAYIAPIGGGGGGGGGVTSYPSLLISEVKIAEQSGDKNIFLELYNPTASPVDLTNWYIFRNGSSFVTQSMMQGKTIPANGYLLITKQGSIWDNVADLSFSGTLNDDDEVTFKNPNGDAVDNVSWTQIATGLSFGRAWDSTSSTEKSFELQTPTPKAQNVTYVALAPVSSDASIISTLYTVSALASGSATITNVPFGTSKSLFEGNLAKNQSGQTWDDSHLSDPIQTGDILTVTAQDGTTQAVYTVTADAENWAQGTFDSFTPQGKFVLRTSDFMPNQTNQCVHLRESYKDVYPDRENSDSEGSGQSSCASAYPNYSFDMSSYTAPGEYDLYLSYCGGQVCTVNDRIGDYYRMYFDGSVWSYLPIDTTKTRLSRDAELTSNNSYIVSDVVATYVNEILVSGTGTISNVRLNTAKADFEAAFTPSTYATVDYSNVHDPVLNGDTILVTAQDTSTKTAYTVYVDDISWSAGIVDSYTSTGQFYFDIASIATNPQSACDDEIYQSLYPFKNNRQGTGNFGYSSGQTSFSFDAHYFSVPGDYSIWLNNELTKIGQYYNIHFDGTNWSAISSISNSNVVVTSATYTISSLVGGSATIINVPSATSKSLFESNLAKNQSGQTWDDSHLSDPIQTGDILTVTAQDGTTQAVYTVTVNP